MYNTEKILKDLTECRANLDHIIAQIEASEKSVERFYKKGVKRAGKIVRKNLLTTIDDIKSLRADLLRMTKEREIFKGTKLEDDFKME